MTLTVVNALLAMALFKCLAGFVLGLVSVGQLFEVNSGGVPGFLPWAFSAWLGYAAIRCWRDGGLDARYLGLLWALVGSWAADRSIRVYWAGVGEILAEGAILAVYVVILIRLGILRRLARSVVQDLRRIPQWIWVSLLASPVMFWSTPGAWLPLTATVVYGPAVLGSSATIRTMGTRGART